MELRHLGFLALLILVAGSAAALGDPHPAGLRDHKFNGPIRPVTQEGITTFRIEDRQCSKVRYGDGRGESDCFNGNVRSAIGRGFAERPGQSVDYRFDIWVDPAFSYPGYFNSHASGFIPSQRDSRLRIATWEGPLLHNFLYILRLEARNGVTFLGKTCFGPERFGQWNSFSMKIRWASDRRGWIRATCNGETIYLDEKVATNQAPHCYVTNQCEPGKTKNPRKFLFLLGPVMQGFGYEWKKYGKRSQFTDIQKEGITIKVRNVAIEKGARLYEAADVKVVRALQSHLKALGCDPGPVDGAIGARTTNAALGCRSFAKDQLPAQLDLTTAATVLNAYQETFPVK